MIVGTAGHIDHGKTTLVRALTGVDTDRLPEEKRRGISIELGYAFMPVPGAAPIGFVDVPGHEKLVHTMLAGATGMDAVLLLIAADDGVMPQTREHLAIASLLGIERAAIVLTKCDRVPAARVEEVRRQAAHLVEGTAFDRAPVFATAALAGDGLEALRRWLAEEAAGTGDRASAGLAFRLAVDRVFTLAGVGTVITGTVFAGAVTVGDTIRIVPTGRQARVRSVHAQNRPAQTAQAGSRCALNVAGVDRDEIERGQWVCDPRVAAARERIDACVEVWPGQPVALRSGQTVHLHLGAADVLARVVVLQGDVLVPGSGGFIQLVLRQPTGAWLGDRFVLRDAAAKQTIAGGRVLDPSAPARYRKSSEHLAQLEALQAADPGERLQRALDASAHGFATARIRCDWGLVTAAAIAPDSAFRVGDGDAAWVLGATRWEAMQHKLLDTLAQQHRQEPDSIGLEAGRLKRMALPRAVPDVADAAVEALVSSGQVLRQGAFLQLTEHAVRLSEQERQLVQRIAPLIEAGGSDPPWVRDLARDLKQPEGQVRSALARQARQGEVFQVVKDLYVHRSAIEKLASTAREVARRDGVIRAAPFRDATGLGRKRAIQFLEFFDRIGLLRRVRDDHLVRPGTTLFAGTEAEAKVAKAAGGL